MTVLECGFCAHHIAYLGDTAAQGGVISLGEHEQVLCGNCGAVFGDADELFVVEAILVANDPATELDALRARVAELEAALALERANKHQFSETSRAYFHALLDIEDLLAQSENPPDRAEVARIISEARETAARRVAKIRAEFTTP